MARKILFMASLSATQSNPLAKALYNRLLEKGKSKKVALIAVAHKLIRIAFGVIKHNMPFNEHYAVNKFS
jgi:transposase